MKKRRLRSFFKGIIISFSIAIAVESFVLVGVPLLGLDLDNTLSYVTDTIDAAKNFFVSSSQVEAKGLGAHKITDGPMEGSGSYSDSSNLSTPENTGEEYSFDTTTYPYRELLSDNAKSVYNQIYANAMAYNTNIFTLVNSLSESELNDTMNCVFNDHPELFWLNTSYKYGYNKSGKVVQVKLSYGISKNSLSQAQTLFDDAVSSIVDEVANYSTDIEKELYIHDAISSMSTYSTNASLNQSAYSALVSGSTVCAGYARAFQIVCQNSGITCYYITGTASGSDHAWNIVYIDGGFYNVDVTWDDSISESYGSSVYTYFNLTDNEISVDHTRSSLSAMLPDCNATAMSYTNVYGSTIEIDDINNNGGQITDGNFTIDAPPESVTDWKDASPDTIPNQRETPSIDIYPAPRVPDNYRMDNAMP